ncbi:hypothetical protein CONLIGDRAFT_672342 [Coniochaeta ligniaria NRRL 30616]|uniref:Uncharacterized protein n=1 Tax=Coniochaeta ligniaria NRRL 30616 TaxID=1408157 RepID=A0A1J7IGL8_9PEZI|nr:hypothetical protein CONLIGDRAFT_672342 [Coniochaeta ligniaria NRRL 30616]
MSSSQGGTPGQGNTHSQRVAAPAQSHGRLQPPSGRPPGAQPLSLWVPRPPTRRTRRFLWACFGDYGRAGAIWACLAVVTALVFFLLQWFKEAPQDPYSKAAYEEQRYQSDLKTREYCLKLREAQLPWSNLDCEQILAAPFLARPDNLENTGQATTPRRGITFVLACILDLLRGAVDIFGIPVPAVLLITWVFTWVLVAVLAPAQHRRREWPRRNTSREYHSTDSTKVDSSDVKIDDVEESEETSQSEQDLHISDHDATDSEHSVAAVAQLNTPENTEDGPLEPQSGRSTASTDRFGNKTSRHGLSPGNRTAAGSRHSIRENRDTYGAYGNERVVDVRIRPDVQQRMERHSKKSLRSTSGTQKQRVQELSLTGSTNRQNTTQQAQPKKSDPDVAGQLALLSRLSQRGNGQGSTAPDRSPQPDNSRSGLKAGSNPPVTTSSTIPALPTIARPGGSLRLTTASATSTSSSSAATYLSTPSKSSLSSNAGYWTASSTTSTSREKPSRTLDAPLPSYGSVSIGKASKNKKVMTGMVWYCHNCNGGPWGEVPECLYCQHDLCRDCEIGPAPNNLFFLGLPRTHLSEMEEIKMKKIKMKKRA